MVIPPTTKPLRILGIVVLLGACSSELPEGSDEAADDEGLETSSSSDTETDEGPPPCDFDAWGACSEAALDARATCSEPCPEIVLGCGEAACTAGCELEYEAAELDCQSSHCMEPPDEVDMCMHECWLDASSCLAASSCEVHDCQWEVAWCLSACYACIIPVELDYAFEGGCELTLPEPIDPILLSFASIEIADQTLGITSDIAGCSEPASGAVVEDDVMTLCEASCDAFAEAGLLRAVFGGPCGP